MSVCEILERERDIYRRICRKCTFDEKLVLLDHRGDWQSYRRELYRLAVKYRILQEGDRPPEL